MDLDWITLYDYMTIHSQTSLREKINKFYESFYPLKLKKQTRKKLQLTQIQRAGLLGIIATYINRVLSVLNLFLEAEFLLAKGENKQLLKLTRMFVEIQSENLEASLRLEKAVYVIQDAYQYYIAKEEETKIPKSFLELKLMGSLKRIFQFYYNLEEISGIFDADSYAKIYGILKLNSVQTVERGLPHFKLFPEIRELMTEILKFFSSEEKEPFNFHAHLSEDTQKGAKLSFGKKLKEMFSIMPNKLKELFMILSDENFVDFLAKSGFQFPKEPIENYFRSQQEINALIAEQQNFLESILVSEKFRGKPEWRKSVLQQLVNLSSDNRKWQKNVVMQSKKFRFSEDYPLLNMH